MGGGSFNDSWRYLYGDFVGESEGEEEGAYYLKKKKKKKKKK